MIYKAKVTTTDNAVTKNYIGIGPQTNQAIIWKLKNEDCPFSVNWSILKRTRTYKTGAKRCNLCLEETLCIIKAQKKLPLNKRTEIFSKCRHRNKLRICNTMPTNVKTISSLNHNKRSVLRRESRDTNRNIKRSVYSELPIRIVWSNVSSIGPSLRRRGNARKIRPYYPYWKYNDLFIFRFLASSAHSMNLT